jgi:hypothetical protein
MAIVLLGNHNGANSSSDIDSLAVAYASDNTAGNFLVGYVQWYGTDLSLSVPTDTAGNTWTLAISGEDTNDGVTLAIYYVSSCLSGSNTVTFYMSPGTSPVTAVHVAEFSGGVSTLDKTGALNTGSSSPATSASTGALSQADELAIGVVCEILGTNRTISYLSPWTTMGNEQYFAGSIHTGWEWQETAATTALTSSFKLSGSVAWASLAATFTVQAAASTRNSGMAQIF